MNTSVNHISQNIPFDDYNFSSSYCKPRTELSKNNLSHIYSILSYSNLAENWDSYGANPPDQSAIVKAVNFILNQLNPLNIEVFFTAPTADGDIVIELKNDNSIIEFVFSATIHDKIICSHNGDLHADENLNETTFFSYLKWLNR